MGRKGERGTGGTWGAAWWKEASIELEPRALEGNCEHRERVCEFWSIILAGKTKGLLAILSASDFTFPAPLF